MSKTNEHTVTAVCSTSTKYRGWLRANLGEHRITVSIISTRRKNVPPTGSRVICEAPWQLGESPQSNCERSPETSFSRRRSVPLQAPITSSSVDRRRPGPVLSRLFVYDWAQSRSSDPSFGAVAKNLNEQTGNEKPRWKSVSPSGCSPAKRVSVPRMRSSPASLTVGCIPSVSAVVGGRVPSGTGRWRASEGERDRLRNPGRFPPPDRAVAQIKRRELGNHAAKCACVCG